MLPGRKATAVNVAWLERWVRQFGPIPDNVLLIDSETSGVSQEHDLVLELGHAVVRNGVVMESGSVILDWTRCESIDRDWLRRRLDSTREKLVSDGKQYHWTLDVLSSGICPVDALMHYLVRLEFHAREGLVLAGHNSVCFDFPLLRRAFNRFLDSDFEAPENCLDTGAIEKGMQAGWFPEQNETPASYARRVIRRPARIKWSLDRHCAPKYQLAQRCGLDMRGAHRAEFDCLLAAGLLSVYREASRRMVTS